MRLLFSHAGFFGQKGEPMPKQKSDREQYLIRIGETLVPVNREIYGAYYGGERRERYQACLLYTS